MSASYVTRQREDGRYVAEITRDNGKVVVLDNFGEGYLYETTARYDAVLVVLRPSPGFASRVRYGMRRG